MARSRAGLFCFPSEEMRRSQSDWALNHSMTHPRLSFFRSSSRFQKAAIASLSSLVLLTACGAENNPFSGGVDSSGGGTGASTLASSMPEPYKGWKISSNVTACRVDPIKVLAPDHFIVTGYGIINAAKGETPEAFIVEIVKDGKSYYTTGELTERPDVMKKLNNPLLKFSGFTSALPKGAVKAPFTAKVYLGFRDKLFPCSYDAKLR